MWEREEVMSWERGMEREGEREGVRFDSFDSLERRGVNCNSGMREAVWSDSL